MADPYLERMEEAFAIHKARDLHEAAAIIGVPFDVATRTFNNGLLKGYWKVLIPTTDELAKWKRSHKALRRKLRDALAEEARLRNYGGPEGGID